MEYTIVVMVVSLVFFIPFAIEIWRDAERRVREEQPLKFFSAPAWAFLVVWTGVGGIGLYWAMHYLRTELDRGA